MTTSRPELTPWRWVLHVDLDSFFASVEQLDKPSLQGRPVVVGGTGERGVVATASYEARRYGVRSAMPVSRARSLCPEAVFLPPRFGAYKEASRTVMEVLRSYTPRIEPVSLDEAYLDLSAGTGSPASAELGGDPVAVARSLRAEIRRSTGLVASAGVGRTKLVAKLASDAGKPDGLLVVTPERELAFLHPLPVGRIWGVGPATEARLARLGIRTVGELAHADEQLLVEVLGPAAGTNLARLAWGEDPRVVEEGRETKSIGQEETFGVDVADRTRLRAEVVTLAAGVARRVQQAGNAGRTVTLKVRYADFRTVTRSVTLASPTDATSEVTASALALLDALEVGPGVRLLGVSVSNLAEGVQGVLEFEDELTPQSAQEGAPTVEMQDGERLVLGGHVTHPLYGQGWVEALDQEWVSVRFEGRGTPSGRARTFTRSAPLTPDH